MLYEVITEDVGVYFVYNRDSTVPLSWKLEQAFLERFYPKGNPSIGQDRVHVEAAGDSPLSAVLAERSRRSRFVITSYSIHYTKLYEG